jgi:hypothetical protein
MLAHVAVVSWSDETTFDELTFVAAALQKQVIRDLVPFWDVTATVDAFPSLNVVPVDYWPLIIVDFVSGIGTGFHLDGRGQPYAIVEHTASWSLTASHELLEMLCDPWGQRVTGVPSPVTGQGEVGVLVEVCDPCQLAPYAYEINGVLVSDFVTPRFYEPLAAGAARYSFTGAVQAPLAILPGGYLAWWDPVSDHIYLEQWFDATPQFVDLGLATAVSPTGSISPLREAVDLRTHPFGIAKGLREDDARLTHARVRWDNTHRAAQARASRLEQEIRGAVAPAG